MRDARPAIVASAFWLQQHHDRCYYSEGAQRMSAINRRFVLPVVMDCSAFYRVCYNWAGAIDPYEFGYGVREGYTGTALNAGKHIDLALVRPGDAVVLGAFPGRHMAMIVSHAEGNPVCISMGKPGAPEIVRVSQMTYLGEPTYLTFNAVGRRTYYPPGHKKARR
jgi:hypothetical protein